MLWLFKMNFRGFLRFLIHGNLSYVVLYTQCLRYNICSAWFLDIRISTCSTKSVSVCVCVCACVYVCVCVCVCLSWVPSVGDRDVCFGQCTALSQPLDSCFCPAFERLHAGETWQSIQLTSQNPIGHNHIQYATTSNTNGDFLC